MKILTDAEKQFLREEAKYDYIDPMSDVVFKSIFKSDKDHFLIKVIVKELLGIELKEFEEKDPGFIAKGKNKKGEVCDYYVKVNDKYISIECNRIYSKKLIERNISHLRRMIIENSLEVIQINFDSYDIEKKGKGIYKYSIREESIESRIYSGLIKIFHINLSYYKKKIYNKEEMTEFEKICKILTTRKEEEIEKIVKGDERLMDMKKYMDAINGKVESYDDYTKQELTMIAMAEERAEKMVKKRTKEMVKEMLKEETKKMEKENKNKEKQIAKNMLNDGITLEKVKQYTNLPLEEILKIKGS